ncbi:hypothetical protein CK203_031343 [Vitis vinifera]|uniref:Uncharacterized protein n=1 Tax=Vitis vinifera TaxID=29760 RepID=A0A438IX51_VITVI|nr:hypothetical protein CK203_031343 [Vitis vinifera]
MFKGAKFRTPLFQGAKSNSRVPFSHTQSKVRNFSPRCENFARPGTQQSTRAPAESLWNPNSHLPSFRHAKTRGGLSASPSHRRLDHIKPPWERRFATCSGPAIPPSEGEPLLSADTPPGGHPLTLCHRRPSQDLLLGPCEENQVLGSWRAIHALRRPMIAGPPIEGNLDCRDRSFHSETYFDIEALRQQPELRDSFRLLQRYHMEDLLTPRQFYYPE